VRKHHVRLHVHAKTRLDFPTVFSGLLFLLVVSLAPKFLDWLLDTKKICPALVYPIQNFTKVTEKVHVFKTWTDILWSQDILYFYLHQKLQTQLF
jgi:hypothetical protein